MSLLMRAAPTGETGTLTLPGQPRHEFVDYGLTVAEALTIAPLTLASVCAGAAGLARRARWVHVVDHDDIEDSLTGGELILSSGVSLKANVDLQRSIFDIMERKSSAALVLSLGCYLPEIPDIMRRAADRHAIPLIVLPWNVNFRDVTEALLTRIVHNQYNILEDVETVNRSLLNVAVQRGTLDALCDCISDATGEPAAVLDTSLEVLAKNARAECAIPRRHLASTSEAASRTEVRAISLVGDRWAVTAPITVGSRLQGYLILETGHTSPARFHRMVAESACRVAGLLIAQQEEIERVRSARERDDFVSLLEGNQDAAKLATLAAAAPGPYSLMVFEMPGGPADLDARVIRRALDGVVPHARVVEYAQRVIALLPHHRRHVPRAIAQTVLDRLHKSRLGLRAVLSRSFLAVSTLREAYAETLEALIVGRVLHEPDAALLVAEDTAALRNFVRCLPRSSGGHDHVQSLAEHDRSHGSDLLRTLECFLGANHNAAQAARRLDIHRHTLAYRLARIADVLGTALTPELSLELRLQMIAHRLTAAETGT